SRGDRDRRRRASCFACIPRFWRKRRGNRRKPHRAEAGGPALLDAARQRSAHRDAERKGRGYVGKLVRAINFANLASRLSPLVCRRIALHLPENLSMSSLQQRRLAANLG